MIEELGKNKYKLIVNISENGKRLGRRTKIVHCGKREANRMYKEFEDEVRKQLSRSTVDQLVSSYIRVSATNCEETTMQGYINCQKRIISVLGDKMASRVTSIDIEEFIAEMANKYSSKTIKNTMAVLSASFQRAVDAGVLEKNPCSKTKKPTVVMKEPTIMAPENLQKFIKAIDELDLDTKVATELALFCGLRRSEICGLKAEDYSNGVIRIRRTRHIVKNKGENVQKTKNVTSNRILKLPSFLAEDVEKLINKHNDLPYEVDDWLILNIDKAINPSTLCTRITTLQAKHGLPRVSIHALRHTYATMLLNSQAVDIAQISRELGHSQVSTTLNIYSHSSGGASRSSEQIAATIGGIYEKNTTFDTTQE